MMARAALLLLLLVHLAMGAAGPMKLYEKAENQKYQQVLVPVSSTVIPLDDLPQYQVGVGLGVVTPVPGKFRPDGPVKLITIHSLRKKNKNKDKKDPTAARIEEVTPEEYKALTKQ